MPTPNIPLCKVKVRCSNIPLESRIIGGVGIIGGGEEGVDLVITINNKGVD